MGKSTRRERVCAQCAVDFVGDRRLCGPCTHAARKARGGYRTVPCTMCGTAMYRGSTTSDTPRCLACRKARRAAGTPCVDCGDVKPGRTKARCPKCSIAHYAKTAAPCTVRTCERPTLAKGMCSTHYSWYWRALFSSTSGKGTWILPERRLSIYERDGWLCGICGDPVDRDADALANLAPSLDHIVPRSLGGGHESENLRTAHRVCNSRRGANVEGVSHDEWASAVRDYRGGASSPAEPGEVWAAV